MKWKSEFKYFHSRKWIWKCRLQNGGYFVSASMWWMTNYTKEALYLWKCIFYQMHCIDNRGLLGANDACVLVQYIKLIDLKSGSRKSAQIFRPAFLRIFAFFLPIAVNFLNVHILDLFYIVRVICFELSLTCYTMWLFFHKFDADILCVLFCRCENISILSTCHCM